MHKAFALLILLSANAAAHPGHGVPGWMHPHAADYALIFLGICIAAGIAYGLKKLVSRR